MPRRISFRMLVLGSLLTFPALTATARDLVYTPVNPAFGGSPLNSTYVLGLATSNNTRYTSNKDAQSAATSGTSAISQFRDQITASLLSQIASNIGQQIIGENARDNGTFNLNGTVVQFARAGGQINVNITDGGTGAVTNIQIPVPNY